ncbi:MAG: alpha/beta hydrolase [Actinobacteria bacterium]|nr:alpha/beta hydrolase [Actinomycetota bacterium]
MSADRASATVQRSKLWFESAGERCAAWHYPGAGGACVVMASGGGVPKEPGTDRFAARFQAAGFSVFAFDYRRLGESEGRPRQVIRIRDQLADLAAAITRARALPEVDPERVALWGFSLSGGHVLKLAADGEVAVAIAQTPTADGRAAAPNALRHETLGVILRFPFLAALDLARGALGKPPLVVPLTGPRGSVAMLTTPDSQDANRALNPEDRYPDWEQTIAARSVLPIGFYRPCRAARRIQIPLLVVVAEGDQSALAAPAVRVAERASNASLTRVPGGHYAPFLAAHEEVVSSEIAFLEEHLLAR